MIGAEIEFNPQVSAFGDIGLGFRLTAAGQTARMGVGGGFGVASGARVALRWL